MNTGLPKTSFRIGIMSSYFNFFSIILLVRLKPCTHLQVKMIRHACVFIKKELVEETSPSTSLQKTLLNLHLFAILIKKIFFSAREIV